MELADVLDSKSSVGNNVRVQVPPPAPKGLSSDTTKSIWSFFICFIFMLVDVWKVINVDSTVNQTHANLTFITPRS